MVAVKGQLKKKIFLSFNTHENELSKHLLTGLHSQFDCSLIFFFFLQTQGMSQCVG